jgi:hypothetical protein
MTARPQPVPFLLLILFSISIPSAARAQQPPNTQSGDDSATQDKNSQQPKSLPEKLLEKTDISILARRSLVFPDLAMNNQPLSDEEKFHLFVLKATSPANFFVTGLAAGVNQAADYPSGYGQEAGGYGKRFSSEFATGASRNFFGTFLLPTLLHEDPRFFVGSERSFGQSLKYAARRVVITRKDDGERTFNWSGVLAPLLSQSLANLYLPPQQRTVGATFHRYGGSVAGGFAVNVLRQYWPRIFKRLTEKSTKSKRRGASG